MAEQKNFPFFMLWDSPKQVTQEVLNSFEGTAAAMRWAFDHRPDPNGRSIEWLAHHLGIRRQRLSRMLNQGDFKLDPSLVPMWDFLTGWTAVSQLIERRRDEIKQMRVDGIHKAIQEKVAA